MPLASQRSVTRSARPRRRSEPAAQPPGQPVVRQAHRRRRRGVVRLVLGEPAQLRDGERRHRHDADGVGPRLRRRARRPGPRAAWAERVSFHSSAGRTTSPRSSRQTMPCCWPPTAIAATSSSPPACGDRLVQGASQAAGSTSVPSGCGARPCAHQLAGLGVADDDLARLGRGVDAGDERHSARSACAQHVLERQLVQPDEAEAALGGLVGVELLERCGRRAGRRSSRPG